MDLCAIIRGWMRHGGALSARQSLELDHPRTPKTIAADVPKMVRGCFRLLSSNMSADKVGLEAHQATDRKILFALRVRETASIANPRDFRRLFFGRLKSLGRSSPT